MNTLFRLLVTFFCLCNWGYVIAQSSYDNYVKEFDCAVSYSRISNSDGDKIKEGYVRVSNHIKNKKYRQAYEDGYSIYRTISSLDDTIKRTRLYASLLDYIGYSLNAMGSAQTIFFGIEAEKRWGKIQYGGYSHIKSISNLAVYYNMIGDNSSALNWVEEGLKITNDNSEYLPYYCRLLNTKASIYNSSGRYHDAYKTAMEARKKDKTTTLKDDENITLYAFKCGYVEQAISKMREILFKGKELGYDKNNDFASYQTRVGYCLYSDGDIKGAIYNTKEAIATYKHNRSTLSRDYAQCLYYMGIYYHYLHDYSTAIDYINRSINILHNLGILNNDPLLLDNLVLMAKCTYGKSDFEKTEQYSMMATRIFNENIRYSIMTDRKTRESLWENCKNWYMEQIPSFVFNIKSDSLLSLAYDATLFSKGLLLNTELSHSELAEREGGELKKLFDSWQNTKMALSSPTSIEHYDSLNVLLNKQEKLFLDECRKYYNQNVRLTVTWKDIQKELTSTDIAIEFIEIPLSPDSMMYVALSIKKGDRFPTFTPLFEKNYFLQAGGEDIYKTSLIKEIIWKPLQNRLYGVRNVYFSPAGILHKIGIENLPEQSGVRLYRVSSTREIVLKKKHKVKANAAIYGGLEYSLSQSERQTLLNTYYSKDKNRGIKRITPNYAVIRGTDQLGFLEGSKVEAESIVSILKGIPVNLYMGVLGTEESFKYLSGQKKSIIHISTHGFYDDFVVKDSNVNEYFNKNDSSLTRSGIFLAGANDYLCGDEQNVLTDDGILTAAEISLLDLRDLDMLVLSACDTGLGEITSEGVFGLQRGFKKAGAQSILMSLWKVDDEATCMLMTEFYKNWIGVGKTKHDALEVAKQTVRSHTEKGWDAPKYWAAFILLDALD